VKPEHETSEAFCYSQNGNFAAQLVCFAASLSPRVVFLIPLSFCIPKYVYYKTGLRISSSPVRQPLSLSLVFFCVKKLPLMVRVRACVRGENNSPELPTEWHTANKKRKLVQHKGERPHRCCYCCCWSTTTNRQNNASTPD
jgi:hypothetical protein